MIQIVTADGVQETALIADLRSRSAAAGEEITALRRRHHGGCAPSAAMRPWRSIR